MKQSLIFLTLFLVLFTCDEKTNLNCIKVNNPNELSDAIKNAKAGDDIVLANGVWKDVQIRFTGEGTESNPISIKAETPGEVFIEGVSDLKFGGNYLVVEGATF